MIQKLKIWLNSRFRKDLPSNPSLLRRIVANTRAAANTGTAPELRGDNKSGDTAPGNNVLIRNKYLREDTGTHETLKILDDSLVDSGEETGIDPYNTGGFDRARNWTNRFRK